MAQGALEVEVEHESYACDGSKGGIRVPTREGDEDLDAVYGSVQKIFQKESSELQIAERMAQLMAIEIGKLQEVSTGTLPLYQYSLLLSSEIRLLYLSPGQYVDPLFCALSTVSLSDIKASILAFQALSYAWGDGASCRHIILSDLQRSNGQATGDNHHESAKVPTTYYTFFM